MYYQQVRLLKKLTRFIATVSDPGYAGWTRKARGSQDLDWHKTQQLKIVSTED